MEEMRWCDFFDENIVVETEKEKWEWIHACEHTIYMNRWRETFARTGLIYILRYDCELREK